MGTDEVYAAWIERRDQFQASLRSSYLLPERRQELRDELTQIEHIIRHMEGRFRPFRRA
jgi:hypothetical protein